MLRAGRRLQIFPMQRRHGRSLVKTLSARLPPRVLRGLGEIYHIRGAYRSFLYARGMLCDPITSADAIAAVQARLASRTAMFVDTIERTVFACASSPYRALLQSAGYNLDRVKTLVAHAGIEEALRRLSDDGVYVAIEEFNGIREARRGDQTFRFVHEDFYNPLARPGMLASSGGTRSGGIPTSIPVATGRLNAEHTAVTWAAYGLDGLPVVVWYPESRDIGTATVLNAAARNAVPVRWLKQLRGRFPYAHDLAMRAGALMCGIRLPPQTYVPVGEESAILPWVTQGLCCKGCVVEARTHPEQTLEQLRKLRARMASRK